VVVALDSILEMPVIPALTLYSAQLLLLAVDEVRDISTQILNQEDLVEEVAVQAEDIAVVVVVVLVAQELIAGRILIQVQPQLIEVNPVKEILEGLDLLTLEGLEAVADQEVLLQSPVFRQLEQVVVQEHRG
jgi:hypothetical protein